MTKTCFKTELADSSGHLHSQEAGEHYSWIQRVFRNTMILPRHKFTGPSSCWALRVKKRLSPSKTLSCLCSCPLMLATCSNTHVGLCVPTLAPPVHWRVALNPEPSWAHLSQAGRISVQRMFLPAQQGHTSLCSWRLSTTQRHPQACAPALSNRQSHGCRRGEPVANN